MTSNFPPKRSRSPTEHRTVKRRKQYSTRDIPWSEQKELGGPFREAGKGVWPADRILEEKGSGRSKKYLISWLAHPTTGEEFEPSWVAVDEVGPGLVAEWKASQSGQAGPSDRSKRSINSFSARRVRNRRTAPGSSVDIFTTNFRLSDDDLSPPGLVESPASSVSFPEISETQDLGVENTVKVNLPPLPADKEDFETIQGTQNNPQTSANESSSPLHSFQHSRYHQNGSIKTIRSESTPKTLSSQSIVGEPEFDNQEESENHSNGTGGSGQLRIGKSLLPTESPSERPSASSRSKSLRLQTQQLQATNTTYHTARSRSTTKSPKQKTPKQLLSSPFGSVSSDKSLGESLAGPDVSSQVRSTKNGMATNGLRQSTRITSATPNTGRTSPRVGTRSSSRHRVADEEKQIQDSVPTTANVTDNSIVESPTNDTSILDDSINDVQQDAADNDDTNEHDQTTNKYADEDPHSIVDNQSSFEAGIESNIIHESIEDEVHSSGNTSLSMDSKASSSQESLDKERLIPSVDGVTIPSSPILGHDEYVVPLPAEGKIMSVYFDIIKSKRKAVLRFIHRKSSAATSQVSSKRTIERNEMQELIRKLNDTVTHMDLGLPDLTQYSATSEENATYADYAGSKFMMLGRLIDLLKEQQKCSIVLMAQSGSLQDLIENYLLVKHVNVRRHDRPRQQNQPQAYPLNIDLISTLSGSTIDVEQKPLFIIAFDSSFDASEPQVKHLRDQFGEHLPIIYFLVTNSSEHVDKCIPQNLPSNIRLKVLVRTTYLAAPHLGGKTSFVEDPSDMPDDGMPISMGELQRAVRKSPARKIALIADILAAAALSDDFAANWTMRGMEDLQLDELTTPPKANRTVSVTPQPGLLDPKQISRATTPLARKRPLDADSDSSSKRQRLTPLHDISGSASIEIADLRQQLFALQTELVTERSAKQAAEKSLQLAEEKAEEWRQAHAELQRRYEQRRTKMRELEKRNTALLATIEVNKNKQEKIENERQTLKTKVGELQNDLTAARNNLKAAGGDIAILEETRESARTAIAKSTAMEKSLENTKKDFEFTRTQYQDASNRAAELASQVNDLENQIKKLELIANDSRRGLKVLNYENSIRKHIEAAERFKLEVRNREAVIKKLQDENTNLKSKRGVQTRGSSVQPAGSPGTRSRQASPAPGYLAPPSRDRASVLRNER